jgi:transcriptional regulator with XRE-family HTH domain
MRFGKRIRAERERLKLTQVALAVRIGVGSDIVSKYERDKLIPSVPTLQALARVFGVSMDELCEENAA